MENKIHGRHPGAHALTDCRSPEAHLLQGGVVTASDKRLAIDMSALRQTIWRETGEEYGDPPFCDYIAKGATRRIETHSMLADALAKKMKSHQLEP